jgi:hypothetical protein
LELSQQFDVPTNKRPGPTFLAWSIDLRNRIAKRVQGRQRTVEECTPKYDETWFNDAWKGLQIMSFSYPPVVPKDFQTEIDWYFRRMPQLWQGQWPNTIRWTNILDSQNLTSLIAIATPNTSNSKLTIWCATRDKFEATVYRLLTEVQVQPKLSTPSLAEIKSTWEKEMLDAIAEYTRRHNIPPPAPTPPTDQLQVVIPTAQQQQQQKRVSSKPSLPSQQSVNDMKSSLSSKPALPSQQQQREQLKPAVIATVTRPVTNQWAKPSTVVKAEPSNRVKKVYSAKSDNTATNPSENGPSSVSGSPMAERAGADADADDSIVAESPVAAASPTASSNGHCSSGHTAAAEQKKWGAAFLWSMVVLAVLLVILLAYWIYSIYNTKPVLPTATLKTSIPLVGVPIKSTPDEPVTAETTTNNNSITAAPGSSYQPPEQLGEVTVKTVPYSVDRLPLTQQMIAEIGGHARRRMLDTYNAAGFYPTTWQLAKS